MDEENSKDMRLHFGPILQNNDHPYELKIWDIDGAAKYTKLHFTDSINTNFLLCIKVSNVLKIWEIDGTVKCTKKKLWI